MDYKQELKTFFKDNCLLDEPMARHTTYRTGGKAEVYVYPKTREEWSFVLKLAETENIPLRIIGFGSNILVSGKGIGGIVCSTKRMNQVTLDGEHIKAEAGAALDKVCEMACEAGLAGMEKLSGIPGSVGGAVYMNAGAFGQETFDCLEYFDIIDREGRPATLLKEEVKHAYRKVEGVQDCIILSAGFKLQKGEFTQLIESRNTVLHKRMEKQPLEFPSAGSVFKRPANDYASRLIDDTGLRGLSVGGAKVSEKHAGFIVNFNRATPQDIKTLMDVVREKVKEKHGVELELEQILWGDFD
ncbi:UDP-N-acetylmuramate dehydrogenase [Candidatus Avelusimicrobium gallicola]|uniref:UDP-N-acetylenolpyruvoylglucosamine reductase n=1 Tax=Candidatus Avelusimicrobium gallicola TaxID=2562704 RepID=A0A1Y4DED4_9BACT|nr:UDP-N-acetylmuramate dehydrogenase [Elusimicrobium sp. An273]OUO57437.1 UDP-N-acetylenolpyruvoylglucosamine reductase [Elusimicrobium sp. An273]